MKRKHPKVSVLMPTYNHACYLPQAVQSILNQTYADFELIIVDDNSTDETSRILSEFAQKDARIRVVRNGRTLGRGGARNRAIYSKPRGELIAIMDSDDISLPERLEKQVAFLDVHPEIAVVGAQVMNVDEHGLPTPEQTLLPETHGTLAWTLLYSVPFCNPVMMMRANAIRELGGYQEDSAVEDAEYWSRMVYVGRFANLPEILLHYRMPSDRLSVRMSDWDAPLHEVSRSFIEKLIARPIDVKTSYLIRQSVFFTPELCLTAEEVLQTIVLLQDVFEAMQTKGLLLATDAEEVAELMLNQFRMLLDYSRNAGAS